MPAISVVIAFHRETPYLRPAIASMLRQTWRDFELVLVDNGTRLPPERLGELTHDPRLRWVRLPDNTGIEKGYNAGVAEARGEFIALADSDDVTLPQRLERQLAVLRNDPSVGVVSSLAEYTDEQGSKSGRLMFTLPRPQEHEPYSLYDGPAVTGVTMFRRDLFPELPYREDFPFAAYVDLWARAIERTRIVVLPEVHLLYRCYPAQTTPTRFHVVERYRCGIQLVTARRRSGRPENIQNVLALASGEQLAAVWSRTAAQCLREGFFVLAAYQARRSVALERTVRSVMTAGRLAFAAWRHAPRDERGQVTRMFLTGPVRALGLHPA